MADLSFNISVKLILVIIFSCSMKSTKFPREGIPALGPHSKQSLPRRARKTDTLISVSCYDIIVLLYAFFLLSLMPLPRACKAKLYEDNS